MVRKTIYRRTLEHILEKEFKNKKFGVVLDVGAGSTNYKTIVNCEKYLTLDSNAEHGADIVADAENIPRKNNSVDTVICTGLVEHCRNPNRIVAEFERIVKPNGLVIVSAPFLYEYHSDEFTEDYRRFTHKGLEKLFNGFEVVKTIKIGSSLTTILNLICCEFYFLSRFSALLYKLNFGANAIGYIIIAKVIDNEID